MNFFENGARVKWNHKNPEGWAGNGHATVLRFDNKRAYFGPNKLNHESVGPAFEIKLDGERAYTVWVEPRELEALDEAVAA